MLKIITISFILIAFISNSQTSEFKGEMQWTTFVCGDAIAEEQEKVQTINDSLSVSPNPFQKRTCAYYSFQNSDTISLTVYDVVAQIILSPKTNSLMPSGFYQDSLIMDAFPDGIYFVVLKIGQQTIINRKIIKAVNAGISEIILHSNISIYPNPVSSTLHISTEPNEFDNSEIEIINSLGQIILKLPFQKEVNVSNLISGCYLLKIITSSKQEYYSKFIRHEN